MAALETAFGSEHPDTARSVSLLGAILWQQNDLSGARPLFERALAIYEKVLGPEHPSSAIALSNLHSTLVLLDDFQAARPVL
jgi:hypothetical protein